MTDSNFPDYIPDEMFALPMTEEYADSSRFLAFALRRAAAVLRGEEVPPGEREFLAVVMERTAMNTDSGYLRFAGE